MESSGDILSSKSEETKVEKPPPPLCPPGREPKWNGHEWECVDIVPPAQEPENAPINTVEPAVDPRKELREKAKEFADACNAAVDAGVSVMEVMTIAQQTLLGMQNQ